jgi:hypothetical protein
MKAGTSSLVITWLNLIVVSTGQSNNSFISRSFATGTVTAAPPPYALREGEDVQVDESEVPNGLEVLVVIFFFVAATWLLVAAFYAVLALIVIRLRATGRMDLDDEEFGRLYLFRSRFYIPCGCTLRRYILAFGHDHPNLQGRPASQRNMSRSERRKAIERILLESGESRYACPKSLMTSRQGNAELEEGFRQPEAHVDIQDQVAINTKHDSTCSICLSDYGAFITGSLLLLELVVTSSPGHTLHCSQNMAIGFIPQTFVTTCSIFHVS